MYYYLFVGKLNTLKCNFTKINLYLNKYRINSFVAVEVFYGLNFIDIFSIKNSVPLFSETLICNTMYMHQFLRLSIYSSAAHMGWSILNLLYRNFCIPFALICSLHMHPY